MIYAEFRDDFKIALNTMYKICILEGRYSDEASTTNVHRHFTLIMLYVKAINLNSFPQHPVNTVKS